jgi:hypothetical protein
VENRPAGAAPLNPVEVEVIHLFVQLSRALGHPCKVYNILAVGAPVIYIGPNPSHVTEILNRFGDTHPSIRVAHGEVEALANQIQNMRQRTAGSRRPLSMEVTAAFSKGVLLPELIRVLEDFRDD